MSTVEESKDGTDVAVAEEIDRMPDWNRSGDASMEFARDLDTRWRIANMIIKSGMTKEKRPEGVMAIYLKAYEMGVPLMEALTSMYFIDGKVTLEGAIMDAIAIRRCGVVKTKIEEDGASCRITFWRKLEGVEHEHVVEYTMEDAAVAGLVQKTSDGTYTSRKSNWTRHPKEMLYWRCISKGLKRIAPDRFTGVYLPEELVGSMADLADAHKDDTSDELRSLGEGGAE